ncbi:TetR/AcrR family transcriptional regulator [bacterium]|nr:TetR/AcrR family transcriptional regulator [bacterium]
MGIVERKQREKEQRRNAIIDAAERIFFSKGWDNATIEEVADAAELSKGTIYLYFKTKEDLYLAIHLRGQEILLLLFEAAIQDKETGFAKIRAVGEAYFEFYFKYPAYFNALTYYETRDFDTRDQDSLAGQCLTKGLQINTLLSRVLGEGMEDGSIRSDLDPFQVSLILWGQTTGLIQFASLKGDLLRHKFGVDQRDLFSFYLQFVSDGLRGPARD